ncbi:MAG: biotin--[acetyl-CoA-carboxylase] ligase [Bacteroidia bacterium]|nr:biotin--[acetyl-CoA-carboxylase] ligase [Bacteroidia bacterium]
MPEIIFTGKNRIDLSETPSTNTYANELLITHPPEGTLITTVNQTKGKGQKGNTWTSRPGQNLTFSVIYYPDFLTPDRMFMLSKIASLAVRDTVAEFLPLEDVWIKWPNDILLNRKKVAGILIENQLEGMGIRASIIGIGLNVNQLSFPPEIESRAVSMRKYHPVDLAPEKVLSRLLFHLETWYLAGRRGNAESVNRAYFSHLYGYQQPVEMKIQDRKIKAPIAGISPSGKLAVQIGEKMQYFDFKEIEFVF